MNPIQIDLPLPDDCLHPNARPHWRQKAAATKAYRQLACIVAKPLRPSVPYDLACYRLVFWLPRKRDYNGLDAWMKAGLDGLQDAGIVINDSDLRPIGIERFSGRKQTNGKIGVRIIVWPES